MVRALSRSYHVPVVAVDPALIPGDEEQRLAAVQRYDILDTPADGTFDRITALAARLFDVPIAIVSVVDHDRIWFKSHHGLAVDQIDREPGLCASAILQEGPWIVNDAPRDPRALANPLVAGEFGLKFYAGVPLRTSDGHSMGTLCILDLQPRELTPRETGILEDLAAMVMNEMELRLASRRQAELAKERELLQDAFAGMLSHELRTPATTIYAATRLLSRDATVMSSDLAQDLFPDVTAETERLLRLIEDLLVLTRVERGLLEPGQEPILLQRVLPRVVEQEGRRWPDRSIRLDVGPDLPPVSGDQVYLEQVAANLLSNGLKYSTPGTGVDVSAVQVDDEVEVRVRDRGIGLRSDNREAIFELLFRTAEGSRHAGGAGIGLYVCRRLLEAMNGRIWAEAAPDQGTVFAFRLPVASD
ncbi:MAG: GAF domain-containing protein [Chloroflexi bacterium]|nr:GAF domain-containing protein [Chloroflexota bacterium]